MEGGGAYGAGKAGSAFDPIAFIKRPQVILRIVSWIFAIIVFGCISAEGYYNNQCMYNGDENACNFGIAIGVLAFLACMVFLVTDAVMDQISSVEYRKYIVMADLGFSAFWTFMWFVCFCYLADAWRKSPTMPYGSDEVQAAIAFSFFSIISWAGLTALAVMRFRQGSAQAFSQGYEPDMAGPDSSPYTSYPTGGDASQESYQEPPFSGGSATGESEYKPPTY
ncbi:synaptogyrin-3-like isoform X2 [Saccoglossus kowalevskii]|uniref:Synaptogyrin n=1 Tax=Saccoglossus kowalevskii TaxID=10224 RepID=A0ABM0GSY0_SACKO|nr:PREDICTED: synaptogyrin-3-like isoform 1 [Saccoglossus kowalevskii]